MESKKNYSIRSIPFCASHTYVSACKRRMHRWAKRCLPASTSATHAVPTLSVYADYGRVEESHISREGGEGQRPPPSLFRQTPGLFHACEPHATPQREHSGPRP